MAAPTQDQLDAIRVFIGDAQPPTDDDLFDKFIRLGTVEGVALEVLKARLANLLSGPASFSVSGYSENNTATIAALQGQITTLAPLAEAGAPSRTVRSIPVYRRVPRR